MNCRPAFPAGFFREVTLAPHFVTSQADFGEERRKLAGDVIVAAPGITSLSKNEIKWTCGPAVRLTGATSSLSMSQKMSKFAFVNQDGIDRQ